MWSSISGQKRHAKDLQSIKAIIVQELCCTLGSLKTLTTTSTKLYDLDKADLNYLFPFLIDKCRSHHSFLQRTAFQLQHHK